MSLLDIIPEDTKAKAIEVTYHGELFTTFIPKDLPLPVEKYRVVFMAVEQLINSLDEATKSIVMEESVFKSVTIAMSEMMTAETLIKFIETDSLLKEFKVTEKYRVRKTK